MCTSGMTVVGNERKTHSNVIFSAAFGPFWKDQKVFYAEFHYY